jgi:hypothetical protein
MPPRWPRQPDRTDPAYRRLDDRMNFATHVAIFAAVNSGLWFFRLIGENPELSPTGILSWTTWITGLWGAVLLGHALFVFAIAKYEDAAAGGSGSTTTQQPAVGFQAKSKSSRSK